MDKVAVVVPIYKEVLTESEKISFHQTQMILHRYPIYCIMPQRLKNLNLSQGVQKEIFSNEYFLSTKTYSELMLNPKFYMRFNKYKYILICQLDAFVFSDRMEEFCEHNYDYIGAPTPRSMWKYCGRVGNGGFSLRKVESCIRVTKFKEEIYEMSNMKDEFEMCEDKFFGYCGINKDIDFRVPNVGIATKFSIENNIAHCHDKLSEDNLPFGCHGWSKSYNYILWKKYIGKFYADLLEVEKEIFFDGCIDKSTYIYRMYREYIHKRIVRRKEYGMFISEDVIPSKYKYVLWGSGMVGKKAYELLTSINREIVCFFDINNNSKLENGIKVVRPNLGYLKDEDVKIIVTTTKFIDEIIDYLDSHGLREEIDYYDYRKVERKILSAYCSMGMRKIKSAN